MDLNLQFPAGWKTARKLKFEKGFAQPAPCNFVGYKPLSEPEAIAIYNFTLKHNFNLVLAFHTQGQEIYWEFMDYATQKNLEIGKQFSKVSRLYTRKNPIFFKFCWL